MSILSTILPRLAVALGALEGEPVALEGGITNRNYVARLGGRDYVVRVCGKDTGALGIDRTTECLATERAAVLGIGPPVALRLADEDVLVTGFLPGGAVEPDALREPAALAQVAAGLRAFHDGDALPTAFAVFRLVEAQAALGTPPAGYDALLAIAHRIEAALEAHPEHRPVPCHNDLLPANFIRDGDRLYLVDWEYAGMNDRYFDLGNLAVNNGLSEQDDRRLLEAYWHEPTTERRFAALQLMRFISDFREAMWGVAQGELSELDFDYDNYAREHVARMTSTSEDPRFEEWITVAATP
jgi:aminoglycoside phosphotransferase (APT) family kinase protein